MKTFFAFAILILLANPALANKESPKSDLEIIISNMAQQYAKSAAQDLAVKKLEEAAAKALSEHTARQVANGLTMVLSVVGVVENVNAYNDAKSEGQRYSAFSQGIATTISIATAPVPIIGLMAQLVVVGQSMTAAFISKDFLLEQAKIRAEISRLHKEASELQKREFDAEYGYIKGTLARLTAITALLNASTKQRNSDCEEDGVNYKNPEKCLVNLIENEQLITKHINTLKLILQFNGRFLNTASLGINVDGLAKEHNVLEKNYQEISSAIHDVFNNVVYNQILSIKSQEQKEMLNRNCEVSVLSTLKDIILSKKEVILDKESTKLHQALVLDHQEKLNKILRGLCSDFLRNAPANLQNAIHLGLKP